MSEAMEAMEAIMYHPEKSGGVEEMSKRSIGRRAVKFSREREELVPVSFETGVETHCFVLSRYAAIAIVLGPPVKLLRGSTFEAQNVSELSWG